MTDNNRGHCDSGNGLTGDGSGLCLRPATAEVEITASKAGIPRRKTFRMCKSCANHWALLHPRTVRILSAAEVSL